MNAQTTLEQMMTAAVADIRQQVIVEMQPRPPKPAPSVAAGNALLGPRGDERDARQELWIQGWRGRITSGRRRE